MSADRARIERLANAERAFAASAATAGVKTAFVAALSDDATLFRPGPVKGRAYIAERPERPYTLVWQPQRVAVAMSDDLGYSSGPSRLVVDARPDDPRFGQFFSIWRREPDGRWALLFDHGSGNRGPAGWTAPFDGLFADGSIARGAVEAEEALFDRLSMQAGIVAAYRAFGSARLRLLRDDADPIDGVAALATLPEKAAAWRWSTIEHGTSRAADLAWTFGRFTTTGDRPTAGWYVRVWRAEGGVWKIVGDVLAPADG